MSASTTCVSVCAVVFGLVAGPVMAVNIDTVPVGNPGNVGELSGQGAGGYGPDAIVGGVAYEYRVGRYEVTAAQYTEFLNAVAKTDTYELYNANMWLNGAGCKIQRSGSSGSYFYSVAPDYANRPVNFVSFWDAARFANWMNNGQPTGVQGPGTTESGAYTLDGYNGTDGRWIQRNPGVRWAVPSEDEWYKAAYHKNDGVTGNYWDYPTGSDSAPGRDMDDASGNNANYWTGSGPYPIDSGKYTTLTGEFQNSDSPYGTFDQGGNVWEWNETVISGSSRGARGGSFDPNEFVGLYAGDRLDYFPPTDESDGQVGFRVAYVPEPGSALVLLAGSLGIGLRRRKV